MVVMKFGGKSLSTPEKIKTLCEYIAQRAQKEKIIIVVSAFGDTTDKLLNLAKTYGNSNMDKREIDALLSTGEIQSASLFALSLKNAGLDAQSYSGFQVPITTEGLHGKSVITGVGKDEISNCLNSGKVAVVAGFQGVNPSGEISTLGRGGSDTTAVALGAAFDCNVEIYSDFDGIFNGDPRRGNYNQIDKIDYDSMNDYAQTGAKVLAPSAALLAKQTGTKVICKGSSTPNSNGTQLVKIPKPFSAININDNLCEVTFIYNNLSINLDKSISFLLKNVNFNEITITKNKITVVAGCDALEKIEANFHRLLD